MSWFTVGEITIWLALAAGLGVLLGWLLHEIWNRSRTAEVAPTALESEPIIEPTASPEPPVERLIKGKRKSMIYHVPGSPAYQRTSADEWFASESEAVAAGYRKPKNR